MEDTGADRSWCVSLYTLPASHTFSVAQVSHLLSSQWGMGRGRGGGGGEVGRGRGGRCHCSCYGDCCEQLDLTVWLDTFSSAPLQVKNGYDLTEANDTPI